MTNCFLLVILCPLLHISGRRIILSILPVMGKNSMCQWLLWLLHLLLSIFGNGRGVTLYSFLDESGQLFYSTVFTAAEPESHYVLDGLTHNEVVVPNAHSTDTHGFSEPVFAITGLLNIEFRPRFAGFHHQQLYSINEVRTYKEQGLKIVPDLKINLEHLENHWDEILRLVCTIKLGYSKASTLFRRLNSYSKQHPLYKALKDLGRLYKTAYIYQ